MEKERVSGATLIDQRMAGDRLVMDLRAGDVEIHPWDEGDIHVRAFQSGTARPSIVVEAVREGDAVVVREQPLRRFSFVRRHVSYAIALPRRTPIEIRNSSGNVVAVGTGGGLKVRLGKGDILMRGLGGTIDLETADGRVQLVEGAITGATIRTGSGDIDLDGLAYGMSLASQSGRISVRGAREGQLTVTISNGSFSYAGELGHSSTNLVRVIAGDVLFRLAPDSDLRIDARTANGNAHSSFAMRDREAGRGALRGSLGAGGATLRVDVTSGNIAIDPAS